MNLFLVSQVSQMVTTNDFIKKQLLTDNILVILYVGESLKPISNIGKIINKSLFVNIIYLKLAKFPQNFTKNKANEIYNTYLNLINNHPVDRVFLFSYEHHYSLFCRIILEQEIELNLIEEGLSTYRHLNVKEKNIGLYEIIKNEFVYNFNDTLLFTVIKKFIPFIKETILYPKKIVSFIHGAILSIWAVKVEKSSIFLTYENENLYFDNIYMSFTDYSSLFKAKRVYEYFPHTLSNEEVKSYSKKLGIENKDIIFISQPYGIPEDIYISFVLLLAEEVFKNMNNSKLYIKFHPREEGLLRERLTKETSRLNLINKVIILDDLNGLSIENVIQLYRPQMVIGIASSVLVYSIKCYKDIIPISIYTYLLDFIGEKAMDKKKMNIIKSHGQLIEKFKLIKFISNKSEFKSIFLKKQDIDAE